MAYDPKDSINSDTRRQRHTDSILHEIASARDRQVHEEGMTPKEHDKWTRGQLVLAGVAYAHPHIVWTLPQNRRENLIQAAMLFVAEIERLDRLERSG